MSNKKEKLIKKYVFEEDMAIKYGVESAILIQHFIYSINHHKKNGTHFYDGRYWTYNSIPSLKKIYPFWSEDKIARIIGKLIEKKVLMIGNYNKHTYDHTRWFAFRDEEKFLESKSTTVDESVDKYENPVDNYVDKNGIKNKTLDKKSIGNEPFLSKISPESRGNVHVAILRDRCRKIAGTIPICNSIYSSVEEVGAANSHNGGNSKKIGDRRKNTFAVKITWGYMLPISIRKKIQALGYRDGDIDREVINMVSYHSENPQPVLNEQACVLGWFKNPVTRKRYGLS